MRIFPYIFVLGSLILFAAANAFAQTEDTSREVRQYIEERSLLGSPLRFLENYEMTLLSAPVRAIELGGRKRLSAQQKQEVSLAFGVDIRQRGGVRVTQSQMTEQFDTWRQCIVHGYRSKLTPTHAASLKEFIDSELYKLFPKLREPMMDWQAKVFLNIVEYDPNVKRNVDQEVMQNFEQKWRNLKAVDAVLNSDLSVRNMHNLAGFSYETIGGQMVLDSDELPKIVAQQGLSAAQWDLVVQYANSQLATLEREATETCLEDKKLMIQPWLEMLTTDNQVLREFLGNAPKRLRWFN